MLLWGPGIFVEGLRERENIMFIESTQSNSEAAAFLT